MGTESATAAVAEGAGSWATYRRLLGYVADQKLWFGLAVVGFLLTAGGEAGFAWAFGLIVDAIGAPATGHAWTFPVLMLALALLRVIGSVSGEYTLSRISFRAIHVVRSHLFERLLLMPSSFYDTSSQGHLVSELTFTTAQLRDTTTDALKIIVADGLKVIVFLGAMIYMNWKLTLTFLVVAPLVGAIVRFASGRFRKLARNIQDSMGDVTHVVSEAVSGYREVKIFGGEEYERARFFAASERNRRQNLKMIVTKALSAQTIQYLAAVALAVLAFLVFQPSIGGGMSAGDLATYLGLAGMLANPVKKLSDVNARLQNGLTAARRVFAQLDQPEEEDSGTHEVERVAGAIRLEDVSFGYSADRDPVLREVTLDIEAGQTVALVGRSGAGKSTLAGLIARFYQPSAGRILLDGKPLADYRLSCLRRQIALVTQNVTLFNDTLANNIAYGGLAGATTDAVADAVRRAHAESFIDAMPQGMETVVGDDGALLSGGQRQRIAIARALLKDAPVLILDEATSSLDTVSERHVQAALDEVMRGRTTIVIAHRLSTVENADLIAVVEEGRIVETGDHRTLMAKQGAYAALYESQFENRSGDDQPNATAPALPAAKTTPLVGAWYEDRVWPRLLWPLAALFGWLAMRRRRRFLTGRSRSWRAPVPVVVVGNITAGGTGKTPLVIWLARWLSERGMKPGVVSRGYGGNARQPTLVAAETPAALCGDEAAMVVRRTGTPVAVAADRVRAVQLLLANADVDVVIADDGLQHYALQRDVEIAVLDGMRGVGNGLCLPAGPLREPVSRLAGCDLVVANGRGTGLVPDELVMAAEATSLIHVASGQRLSPKEFAARHGSVAAIAGIGNPARFEATLRGVGIDAPVRAFPDHYRFKRRDLDTAASALVVTEKDAEKIKAFDDIDHCWRLEIEMRFAVPVEDRLRAVFAAAGIALSNHLANGAGE